MYEQAYKIDMAQSFRTKAYPANVTIRSKAKSNTPIFNICREHTWKMHKPKEGRLIKDDNYMTTLISNVSREFGNGHVEFIPGSLNQFRQTELMFLCFLANCLADEITENGNVTYTYDSRHIVPTIEYFLGDGNGIPDIKTKDEFGFSEPELLARVAPPDLVKKYLERVGKPIDIKLEDMLIYHSGEELYEMAQLYQTYSSDSKKKKRVNTLTDELCRILKNKSLLDRIIVLNIYEQLSRPVKNKIYEGDTVLSIALSFPIKFNKAITDGKKSVICGMLQKLQELGVNALTNSEYINSTSGKHESAIVILYGGIDAITFYIDKMGGTINPSIAHSGEYGKTQYEFDLLPDKDKRAYNKLLAKHNIAQSELIYTNEEDCSP